MQFDVNISPGLVDKEVTDKLLKMYDTIPPAKGNTSSTETMPQTSEELRESIWQWKPGDYDSIYEAATDEEKVLIEKELEELREKQFEDAENLRNYRDVIKRNVNLLEHSWLKNFLMQFVEHANWAWGLDVTGIDQVELLEYGEVNAKYDWHTDSEITTHGYGENGKFDRKITLIIQLSDPEDYDGCDLEIKETTGDESKNILETFNDEVRKQGTVITFPSYQLHRITPLTRGMRKSLVAWASGPKWR